MNLNTVKTGVVRFAKRGKLKVEKYSPEILIGAGIVAIVGGTVMACRATLKVEEVLDVHEQTKEKIETALETLTEDTYSEKDAQTDKVTLTLQTGWKLTKLYAPSVILIGGGIACILTSYGILHKRNLALMTAYEAVNTAFKDYRGRVIEELGEEADRRFKFGSEKTDISGKTEEGKKLKKDDVVSEKLKSPYAKIFDESSRFWSKDPVQNRIFLTQLQSEMNDLLHLNGSVFLNEVYDRLDIPRTKAGAVVGWIEGGEGDQEIDFGLLDYYKQSVRDFINGYERCIVLDFNVQGVIYDLI